MFAPVEPSMPCSVSPARLQKRLTSAFLHFIDYNIEQQGYYYCAEVSVLYESLRNVLRLLYSSHRSRAIGTMVLKTVQNPYSLVL